jgi:hypothetical protein
MTVRFSPSFVSYERERTFPVTMTAVPFSRDSDAFSAS